jgi:glycerol kinase
MEYILAIDQGTHASRAVVFDAHGEAVARQLCPIDLARPQPGRAEQDAEQIADSVEQAIREALQQLGSRQRKGVRCCGIATQRSTVLAWRRNGATASAAINWQDTRGAPQLAPLRSRADAIRKISGLPLSAHYGATKLHWLHQLTGNDPDICLGPLSSFLLERLTQEHVFAADHSNAQRMQLFDIRALTWSPTLSDWFDVPIDSLPVCQPVKASHGTLQGCAIPVTAVAGDQNAAWFATGAPDPATALVNLGSGAFVLAAQQSEPGIPELLSSIVYSDAEECSYVVEGTVNGAGNALQWLESHWHIAHPESRLAAWLEQVQHPPLFMNSVGGLGSPWWREDLQPAFSDGDNAYSDAERAAGVAESMVFLLQHNLERLGGQQPVRQLRISGGLSRVAPLCQKLANLSQCPVARPDDREATARGIAWLAAGRPPDWQPPGEIQFFQPAPDAGLRTRYERFTEKLREFIARGNHA